MRKIGYLIIFMLASFAAIAQNSDHVPTGATTPLQSTWKWVTPNDTLTRQLFLIFGNSAGIMRSERIPSYGEMVRYVGTHAVTFTNGLVNNSGVVSIGAPLTKNTLINTSGYYLAFGNFSSGASSNIFSDSGNTLNINSSVYASSLAQLPFGFIISSQRQDGSKSSVINIDSLGITFTVDPHQNLVGYDRNYNGYLKTNNFTPKSYVDSLKDTTITIIDGKQPRIVGSKPIATSTTYAPTDTIAQALANLNSGVITNSSAIAAKLDTSVLRSPSTDPANKYVFQGPIMAGSETYNNGEDDIVQYSVNTFIKGTSISTIRAEAASGQYVAIHISTDTSRTWSAPITVHLPAGGNACESVKLAVIGTRVILFYKELPALGNPYTSGTEYFTYSDNILSGSPTWSTPTAITLNAGGTALVFRIRKLGDGKLHIILWNNNIAENWTTTDGSSWTYLNTLYNYTSSTILTGQVLTEPEFAYLGANKVLVIARNNAALGSGSHPFRFYSTNNLASLTFQGITNIGGVTDTTSKLQVPTSLLADTTRQLIKAFFISRPTIYPTTGITTGATVAKIYGYVNSYNSVIGNTKGYTTKFYYDMPLNQSTFVKGYSTIIPITATRDIITFTSSNYELSNPAAPGLIMNGWQAELLRTDQPNSLKAISAPYSGLVQTPNKYTGNYDYLYNQQGVSKNPDGTLKTPTDGELQLKASAAFYDQKPALKVLNKNGSEVMRIGMANRQGWFLGGGMFTTPGNFAQDSVAGANRSIVAGNGIGVLRSNTYFLSPAMLQGVSMYGSIDTTTNWSKFKMSITNAANNVFTLGALNGGTITTSTLNLEANNAAAGIHVWSGDSNGGRIYYYAAVTGGANLIHSFKSAFSGSIRQTAILDSFISTQSGSNGTTGYRFGLNRSGASNTGIDYAFTGGTNGATSFSMTFGGFLRTTHIGGLSAAPTIAANAGAGTSPTVSISGTDMSGTITVTTGTSPTANTAIATVTFNSAYTAAPRVAGNPGAKNPTTAQLSAHSPPFYKTTNTQRV